MAQLKMRRDTSPVIEKKLPEGFHFELFKGSEDEILRWVELCSFGLCEDATRETFDRDITSIKTIDPLRDCLFVADESGRYVATATALLREDGKGTVHMVASDPSFRGRGIGHAMLAKIVEMLIEHGVESINLLTDDWRLAAIKTYLDQGFKPIIFFDPKSDLEERWEKILLELSYGKVEYIYE